MLIHAGFLGLLVLSASMGPVPTQGQPVPEPAPASPSGDPTAVRSDSNPDAQAIAQLLERFIKTYNTRDAKALSELFAPDAEIVDDEGTLTRGREAIVARFAEIFRDGKSGTLDVTTESLRFLAPDLAIEEGTATLAAPSGEPPETNRYSVIYTRQGGRWLHARIHDEPSDEVSPHGQLLQLEWMLGNWVNESDDEIVLTTCKWSENGNFLLRDFDVKVEGRIALSGTQRIGWDDQRKQFRMWVFDDSGGFAEGQMSRDGDRWLIKGSGVRSDGRSVSFTNAITILGKDRLHWESFDRTIGGESVPGTDRFDLVRRAPLPRK
jgi:uncharacterized protein (TIGR02246 family)